MKITNITGISYNRVRPVYCLSCTATQMIWTSLEVECTDVRHSFYCCFYFPTHTHTHTHTHTVYVAFITKCRLRTGNIKFGKKSAHKCLMCPFLCYCLSQLNQRDTRTSYDALQYSNLQIFTRVNLKWESNQNKEFSQENSYQTIFDTM